MCTNILLIDDDEVFNFVTEKTLKLNAFSKQVKACSSVDQALSYLRKIIEDDGLFPEIIFLDINMPEKDGWDFLNAYRLFPAEVKDRMQLYMLSSSDYESDVLKSQQYNEVRDFLRKPLTTRDLEIINFRLETQRK